MKDTGFLVPEAKLSRVATIYAWDQAAGALKAQPRDPDISKMPGLPSGGGGLYSTAADYFHFAQMMLNGGELNGKRLLKSSTVAMMRTNVLNEQTLNSKSGIGPVHLQPGLGFGYDFAVMRRSACAQEPARQRVVLVVGHCRHLVLERPGERSAVHRHDPAPRRRARARRITKISRGRRSTRRWSRRVNSAIPLHHHGYTMV